MKAAGTFKRYVYCSGEGDAREVEFLRSVIMSITLGANIRFVGRQNPASFGQVVELYRDVIQRNGA